MRERFVMAVDQGTTSTRAVLVDRHGTIRGMAQEELRQYYPQPGWVEHDPVEIWESTLRVMRTVLAQTGTDASQVAALGLTNQRETTVVWERATGRPLYRAVVWQSRQTADLCQKLQQTPGVPELVRARTGLVIDAYFSATKIRWLLDHVPGAQARAEAGELLFGTIDAWLLWNLTGGRVHATDVTNASRTMLYNIRDLRWDDDLLRLLAIPAPMLPKVCPTSGFFGELDPRWLDGARIPVAGMAGDQHAALFGQHCFTPGTAKNTYGTGCFLLMQTGAQPVWSRHGLLTTVAWAIGDAVEYALEGSVFVAGAAVQWLRDELGLIATAAETEALAQSVASTGGVYVVPAFAGLGAPYWDMDARGAVFGLTRGTSRAHLVRAVLESLAYQTRDVLEAMVKDAGIALQRLRVDGGAAANNFLMQFQADILGVPVERPVHAETTVLGAAFFAGLAVGFWQSRDEIASLGGTERVFLPQMPSAERERLYRGWLDAVSRTRSVRP
ncbi:glycerol kinase 2 [Alicyclobacillus cellulosilyticus]|uniref:Glycerol kinase n=1 Tax=Alicyclobacillus cellulosilyticus TaxID=1003997 RepID=A0A917KBD2_9BACL|nr:glycerol kinase 2 [Alicyclobacillus cellulosilyticus]